MNKKDKETLKNLKKARNSDPQKWDVETFASLSFEDYIKSSVKEARKKRVDESKETSKKVSVRLPEKYIEKINSERKGRGLGTKIRTIIDRDEGSQELIKRQIAPLKEMISKLSVIGNEAGMVNNEVVSMCKKIYIMQGVLCYTVEIIENFCTPNEIYLLSAAIKIAKTHESKTV